MIDLLGDLRRRKLGKLFDIIDTDDDGMIDVTDYEALGQRLAEQAGTHMDAVKVAEMRETFKQIWDEFQANADKDGDGKVNKDEFIDSLIVPQGLDPIKTVRYIGLTCNLLFGLADADHNGRISKDEHIRVGTKVLRLSEAEAQTSFSKLDFWKKGYLTMDAYIVAYTEFITSPLSISAGNYLFGNF
jgi:Ca2+-binding EF-hand superfamily protein